MSKYSVGCWNRTDTVSHSSLQPEDRRTGCVGPGYKDGATGVCFSSFAGNTWGSTNTHMMCFPGPGSTLQGGQELVHTGPSQPPNSQENSVHKAQFPME